MEDPFIANNSFTNPSQWQASHKDI